SGRAVLRDSARRVARLSPAGRAVQRTRRGGVVAPGDGAERVACSGAEALGAKTDRAPYHHPNCITPRDDREMTGRSVSGAGNFWAGAGGTAGKVPPQCTSVGGGGIAGRVVAPLAFPGSARPQAPPGRLPATPPADARSAGGNASSQPQNRRVEPRTSIF